MRIVWITTDLALVKAIAIDVRASRSVKHLFVVSSHDGFGGEVTRSPSKRQLPPGIRYCPAFLTEGVGMSDTLVEGTLREIFDIQPRAWHFVPDQRIRMIDALEPAA